MMLVTNHESAASAVLIPSALPFCLKKSAAFLALLQAGEVPKAIKIASDPEIDVNYSEPHGLDQGKGALWYLFNTLKTTLIAGKNKERPTSNSRTLALIKTVLQRGGNIHQVLGAEAPVLGMTPFLYATTSGLWETLWDLKPLLAPTLNAKTVNIVTKTGEHVGVSPLMSLTIDRCWYANQEEKLSANPKDPVYRAYKGYTQLFDKLITWFLASGANVNSLSKAANRRGTPLTASIDFQQIGLARIYLLSRSAGHAIQQNIIDSGIDTGKSDFWLACEHYMNLSDKFKELSSKENSREWKRVRDQKENCRALIFDFLKFKIRPFSRTVIEQECAFTYLLRTCDYELITELLKRFKPTSEMLAQACVPHLDKHRYLISFLGAFLSEAKKEKNRANTQAAVNIVCTLAECGLDIFLKAGGNETLEDMPLIYFSMSIGLPQLALALLSHPIKQEDTMRITPTQGEFQEKSMLWWATNHLSNRDDLVSPLTDKTQKAAHKENEHADALWRQVIARLLPFFLESPDNLFVAMRNAKFKDQQDVVDMISPHLHPEYVANLSIFHHIPIVRMAPATFGRIMQLICRAEEKVPAVSDCLVADERKSEPLQAQVAVPVPVPVPVPMPAAVAPAEASQKQARLDAENAARKLRKQAAADARKLKRLQAEKTRKEQAELEARRALAAKEAEAIERELEIARALEVQKAKAAAEIEAREKALVLEQQAAARAREVLECAEREEAERAKAALEKATLEKELAIENAKKQAALARLAEQKKMDEEAKEHLLGYIRMLNAYISQAQPFLNRNPYPYTAQARSSRSCWQLVQHLKQFLSELALEFPDLVHAKPDPARDQDSDKSTFDSVVALLKHWNDANDQLFFNLSGSPLNTHRYIKPILDKLPIYFIDAGSYYKEQALIIFLKKLFPNTKIIFYGTRVAKKIKRTAGWESEPPCTDYDCAMVFDEKDSAGLAQRFALVKSKLLPLDTAPKTLQRERQQSVRDQFLSCEVLLRIPIPNKSEENFILDLKVVDAFSVKGFGNNYGSAFMEDTGAVRVHHNGKESAYQQICSGRIVAEKRLQEIPPEEFVSLVAFHTRVHAQFHHDHFPELIHFYNNLSVTFDVQKQLTKVLGKLLSNQGLFLYGLLQLSLMSNLRLWYVPLETADNTHYLGPHKNYFKVVAKRWNRSVNDLIGAYCTPVELLLSLIFFPVYSNPLAQSALFQHLSFLVPQSSLTIIANSLRYFADRISAQPTLASSIELDRILKQFKVLYHPLMREYAVLPKKQYSLGVSKPSVAGLYSRSDKSFLVAKIQDTAAVTPTTPSGTTQVNLPNL